MSRFVRGGLRQALALRLAPAVIGESFDTALWLAMRIARRQGVRVGDAEAIDRCAADAIAMALGWVAPPDLEVPVSLARAHDCHVREPRQRSASRFEA